VDILKDKMKILLIVNLCADYRIKLFELLDKMYDIRFLFFSGGEEKYYDGGRHLGNFKGEYLRGFNIGPKLRVNPKLIYELMCYPYSYLIVGISGTLPLFFSFVISKIRRKKFILWTGLWYHPQTLFHRIFFPFVKFIYKHSEAIIVYGLHIKKYLESLGIDSKKIAVAWQVQDNSKFEKFVSEEEKKILRSQLRIKTSKIILFVGRLAVEKGISHLIKAFPSLSYKDVSLLIIGSGPLEGQVKRKIGKENRIIQLPRVPNDSLYRYYAISDIFVLPSITTKKDREPWGFVVNEAMCQGCAIITSNAVGAGTGGLVESGVNGYIFPEGDNRQLKEYLEILLNNDNLRVEMGKRSKEIIKEWTYPKMASGFKKAIKYASRDEINL